MAKFGLIDGDITVLTTAWNALRAGMGTHPDGGTIEDFIRTWAKSTSAFASEAGFFGLSMTGQPKGAALVVLCQFQDGAVDSEFAESVKKLAREVLKGFELQVIRAPVSSLAGDRLLALSGFVLDGTLRKLVPDADGVLGDLSMFSLTIDDLLPKRNGLDYPSETAAPRQVTLALQE